MLTPLFWEIIYKLLYLAAFLLSLWGFVYFKRKRPAVLRIAGQSFSAVIASIFGLIILLMVFGYLMGCGKADTTSSAIYSPDHTQAVFLMTYDYGATGGETTATLYSHHGLGQTFIYDGEWQTVQEKNIHWLSNSELQIQYESGYPPVRCQSSKAVKVTCEAAQ
jgi:hypothetical protein